MRARIFLTTTKEPVDGSCSSLRANHGDERKREAIRGSLVFPGARMLRFFKNAAFGGVRSASQRPVPVRASARYLEYRACSIIFREGGNMVNWRAKGESS